ncbi:uncharacterized protein lrrc66 [Salminus brasiliensis]|uniref:uncharacterized protein lrrc66 n=1 Tax=Salminus brasiliensis TaxID=930266 RepID=UPI003B835AAC
MSASSLVPFIAILLLQLWGAQTFSHTVFCPTPCLCQKTLLNCSSSGLSEVPSHIPATATALDLSHNALHSLVPLGHIRLKGLQHFWVGDNALESLSMCLGKGAERTKILRRRKEWCVSWAPDLQLLSAERNQLKRLPSGLGSIKPLQVLHFAHNKISALGSADLVGCMNLREVHLQHNLINTIHPQAFKDLPNLQVLDLSNNLLTIIPLPAYLSLRNLNALVPISGNRWRCDCNLKTIRRWLNFDNELGNPTWKVDCFSPSHHAGKDLAYLGESDLTCPPPVDSTPGFHKELTVDEGTELLLSCGAASKGLLQTRWWTPQGHVSENQQVLLLSNITEQHAGHYVCISGVQYAHVSIFNLHVRKKVYDTRQRREARSALDELTGEENMNMERNVRAVGQPDFVLAVCLSVFITFIVAFVLGVLLRPLLDKLCQKIRTKRDSASSSSTNSRTSSARPRAYENEGFSESEEQVQEVRVGSRVTFGGVTEVKDYGGNVPYYVTVEDAKSDGSSESNTDVEVTDENAQGQESLTNNVTTHVEMEELRSKESSNPTSSKQVSKEVPLREENPKVSVEVVEYEPIPDPEDTPELEERRISTVSFQSEVPQEQQSVYEVNESAEQSVDSFIVITHGDEEGNTGHEATSLTDPFSESLSGLKEENVDDLDKDSWNDSGESFSFPDDSRSSSRITQSAVLDYPLFEEELSVDKQSDHLSSCNSSESGLTEGEQTEYTVNPEEDEESETANDPHSRFSTPEQDALTDEPITGARFRQDTITLDPSDVHIARVDSFDDEPFTVQSEFSDNNFNGYFNAEQLPQYHVHPVYRIGQKTTSVVGIDEAGASVSSEDEETEAENECFPQKLEIKIQPEVNSECVIPVKEPSSTVDINFDNSSSSTDMDEKFNRTGAETVKEAVQPSSKTSFSDESFFGKFDVTLDLVPKVKRYLHFSHSEPQHSVQSPSTSLKTETLTPVLGTDSSSEDGDGFFTQTGTSFERVPKVKRYIQFTPSQLQSSTLSPSTSLKTETITPTLAPKAQSGKQDSLFKDNHSPTTNEENFFEQIGASLDEVPKVQRYIQFTPSEVQPSTLSPSTSLKTDQLTPVLGTKTQSIKSDCPSEDGDGFFGQIDVSTEGVPKVKRYIQFTPLEPQSSTLSPSTSLKTETITPTLAPKAQSGKQDSLFKDNHSPTTKEQNFFEQIGASLDEVPKVQRYIQFTSSEVQPSTLSPSTSLKTETLTPVLGTKTQPVGSDSEDGDGFFGQIDVSTEGVPKVKRYIQFTPSEPQSSTQSPSTSLRTEKLTPVLGATTQSIKSYFSSEDGDGFFKQTGTPFEGVPKVKRYIQFTPTEPQPSTQSPSTSLNTETITPTLAPKAQSKDNHSPTTNEENFFEQIGASLDEVPKVQRYIQFTPSEVQPSTLSPSTSLKTDQLTPVLGTKTQSIKSDCPSEDGDGFFGQIDVSTEGVPKVKRYIQFTPLEPQPSTQSPSTSLRSEKLTPVLGTTPPPVGSDSLSEDGDGFFTQVGTSFDGVPKVKRYIQFTSSEPQPLSPSTSLKTETITPTLAPKAQSGKQDSLFKDNHSPTTNEKNFFEQIGASLDEVPKVQRYIQFTPSEVQPSTLSPSTSEKIPPTFITTQSGRSDPPSEDRLSPTTEGDGFFEQVCKSIDGVPKVKRYIQFSQSEPQPSTQSPSTSFRSELLTPVLGTTPQPVGSDSLSEDGDGFFRQTGTSFEGVPKVKRYIQFTPSELQPSTLSPSTSLNTETITPTLAPKAQSGKQDSLFKDNHSPTTKEQNFFEQIGASLDEVPKVQRYIQFTSSEVQPSTLSPSTSLKTETLTPVLGTKTQPVGSDSEDGDGFFGQIDVSTEGVPKVKRYIQFTPSEPQSSTQSPSTSLRTEKLTPVLGATTQSIKSYFSSEDGDGFFKQTGTPFEGVPKVKRYIQFTPTEPQPSTQSPSTSLNTETITPTLAPKAQSKDNHSPTTNEENFFEQIGASLDEVPKVQRYIQFTPSEVQPSTLSPSTSLKTDQLTPVLGTKTQSIKSDCPSEDGDGFFGQIDVSTEGVPKVKRYIQFTPLEPQPSTQSPSTSLRSEKLTPVLGTTPPPVGSDSLSEDGDGFFTQVGTSFDGVPKVKRYIQFTSSEPQPLSPSTSLKTETITPTLAPKAQSGKQDSLFKDNHSPTTNEKNFFEQIGASLDEVPKVQRYIQFTPSEVQPSTLSPSTSLRSEQLAPVLGTTPPPVGSDSLSEDGDGFFTQTGTSFEGVPKVKRYIQFTPSQLQPSTLSPSTSLNTETITPTLAPKAQSGKQDSLFKDNHSPTTNEENFFEQIGASFDEVPKVQGYIQFTPSEVQPSTSEKIPPTFITTQSGRSDPPSEDRLSPTTEGDSFFEQVCKSIDGVPKVKRYIQFSQSEPQPSTQSPSTSFRSEQLAPVLGTTPQPVGSDSEDGDGFFGQISMSVDEVPKVNRYIQFTPSEPLSQTLPTRTSIKGTGAIIHTGTEDGVEPAAEEHSFFGPIEGIPKVKKYIQFTYPESQHSAQSPTQFLTETELKKSFSSPENVKPNEENFFAETDTSLYDIPKLKRYIQFTAESPPSGILPDDKTKPSSNKDNFMGGICLTTDNIPTIKRSLQFTQSEPQHAMPLLSPPLNKDELITELVTKRESTSSSYSPDKNVKPNNHDNLFGQLNSSLDGVPKINRYIQFSQTESSRSEDDSKPGSRQQNQIQSLSSTKDSAFDMKVATETSMLDQMSRPKRTLFFSSNSDPYGQSDQSFTSPQARLRQRISHSQFVDEEDSNAQDSSPASSETEAAREYLRDSSQARQKQERRRLLFQQKRRAMDGFNLTSHSSILQERDKQGSSSDRNEETIPFYSRHIFRSVSTGTAATASHEHVNVAGSEGLSAKSISSLRYKSRSDV